MRVEAELRQIRKQLAAEGTRERAIGEKKYLKSDLEFLGVAVPKIRRAVTRWLREQPELTRKELVDLAKALWSQPVHELRSFSVGLLRQRLELLKPSDMRLVQRMVNQANTWAHVDEIAVRVAGGLVECYPDLVDQLDDWAEHDNFWVRRSAMLALLLPLRDGTGDWPRFERYATAMIDEREFFIRKAIGWVLREASENYPAKVRQFVKRHIKTISGVTIREAVRHLPAQDRDRLLAAYRAR